METSNMHIGKDTTRYDNRKIIPATFRNGDLLNSGIVYIREHQNCVY